MLDSLLPLNPFELGRANGEDMDKFVASMTPRRSRSRISPSAVSRSCSKDGTGAGAGAKPASHADRNLCQSKDRDLAEGLAAVLSKR